MASLQFRDPPVSASWRCVGMPGFSLDSQALKEIINHSFSPGFLIADDLLPQALTVQTSSGFLSISVY